MEIPQPPSDPRARARNHQLIIAGVLSFSLAGLFLILALEHPGEAMRWVLLAVWIAFAVGSQVFAWRSYYRRFPPEPWPGAPPRSTHKTDEEPSA